MNKPILLVSFSGGKTSGYMCWMLLQRYSDKYTLIFVFANTGQEHEKTLEFVDRCDKEFGLDLVWLECVVHHGERVGTTHTVVDYNTACRDGRLFEEVIKKYGIPNKAYPHCNRELKLNPIHSWAKQELGDYQTAIGIRCDEPNRLRDNAKAEGIIYPLASFEMVDKIDVNDFWEDKSFNLEIPTHYGNCKTCWKKSDRKLFTIMQDHPEWFDLFDRMEREYPLAGHNIDGTLRTFFRRHRTSAILQQEAAITCLKKYADEPMSQQKLFGYNLDEDDGCTESCEAV